MSTTATLQKDKNVSLTGTILFHAALVASLFLFKCQGTGGGGGNDGLGYSGLMSMDVAGMGNDIDGWGDNPDSEAPAENSVTEPVIEDNNAITDENASAETPVVNNKPNNKPADKPKDPNTKPKDDPKPQISGGLSGALGNINKGGNGNTSGSGNQGAADGKIDGKGTVSGGGSAGTGGGQGGGNGTGTGPGNGPGSGPGSGGLNANYSLSGRTMNRKPSLKETAPEEGVVVVDIWVDKNGNVTKAVANAAKSQATSAKLFQLAEKAAREAKFSSSGQNEQKGTITITFKLN
ncbi:MAG: energy transducer TonB [Flavobacteriales bacterium]|nr:energy transducer TonB [Flavobacteriales bacterium]